MFFPSESSLSLGDDKEASLAPSRPAVRKLALVTGASSGIGRALAVHHAARGGDLVVTARREEALRALKAELESQYEGIRVEIVPADLSQPNGARLVYDKVKELGLEVDYLINNAGCSRAGSILDQRLDGNLSMIQVNVSSVVALTHLFAADMVASGKGGKVLIVGSIAGFMPGGPYQAVYFASKAFLSSFSQSVDQELRGSGVTCTLLAPGPTDTEIFRSSGLEKTKLGNETMASPESVAQIGYQAMLDGKLHVVCDARSMILSWLMPVLPRRWALQEIEELNKVVTDEA
jgi:short-subunit dehydrogenase